MGYESLILEMKRLTPPSRESIYEYMENADLLIGIVNDAQSKIFANQHPGWKRTSTAMLDGQAMHVKFMGSVFRFEAYEALLKLLHWLNKVIISNHLPPSFIPEANQLWINAMKQILSPETSASIIPYYQWMEKNFSRIASAALPNDVPGIILDPALERIREDFLVFLTIGDFSKCLSLASEFINSIPRLMDFYLQIIQPCMYEIGHLWEEGEISAAQEHLVSSMVTRIISYFYIKADMTTQVANKAIIATAPYEFHELGARMVADFLELHGWKVGFLGANTPIDCIIDMVNEFEPDILGISVTMFSNLDYAEELIRLVRKECRHKRFKIIVGGYAFQMEGTIWRAIGADGCSNNAREAVTLARSLVRDL
ncbi:MAG: cobalamin-dependent protein [Clostridia bacterium]|nr:cobalamin-dependent protein [Clostridia bacterium]